MAMTIPIKPGQPVSVAGRLHEITRVVGFDAVLARDQETGEIRKVAIAELELPIEAAREGERRPDLAAIPQKDWDAAQKKFEAIKPLLGKAGRTAADADASFSPPISRTCSCLMASRSKLMPRNRTRRR